MTRPTLPELCLYRIFIVFVIQNIQKYFLLTRFAQLDNFDMNYPGKILSCYQITWLWCFVFVTMCRDYVSAWLEGGGMFLGGMHSNGKVCRHNKPTGWFLWVKGKIFRQSVMLCSDIFSWITTVEALSHLAYTVFLRKLVELNSIKVAVHQRYRVNKVLSNLA